MQVGIIGGGLGFGCPSLSGLLATMALSGNSSSGRGFRFVYKNEQDNEEFSQIFPEDSLSNRADFLSLLRHNEFNYDEQCALNFAKFKDTEQIYKEVI